MAATGDLNAKALSGSLWSLLEKFSLQIVQFVVSVILARILGPTDYGLVALTMIFTAIAAAITDAGFEKTLIHQKELSGLQLSTIFYINIVVGAIITGLLILVSPQIADFFNAPALTPVLRVTAVVVLINSFGQVQSTLLRKEFGFKKLSYAQMVCSLTAGIIGVAMAYLDFGVWALVYSTLCGQVVLVLIYWLGSSWYPKLQFSYSAIKPMLAFGGNILFSSILFFAIQQFNVFIVGKFYSKATLGLFNRGMRFPEMVIGIIEGIILKVSFPLFSKAQDDNDQLKGLVEKSIRIVAFISFPLLSLLLLNAYELTILLFTEKWAGSIIFLQLFCLVKMVQPFVTIYRETILAKGNAKLLSRVLLINSLVEVLMILFAVRFGIIYVVWATLLSAVIQYIVYSIIVSRRMGFPWYQHLEWIKAYVLITALMCAAIFAADYLLVKLDFGLLVNLIVKGSVGAAVYILASMLFRVSEISYFKSVVNIVQKKIGLQRKHAAAL